MRMRLTWRPSRAGTGLMACLQRLDDDPVLLCDCDDHDAVPATVPVPARLA